MGLFSSTFAQQNPEKYFIYIQDENGKPFYVRMNHSLLSSTHAGYLIIPQLAEGKYVLIIGLPGDQVAEAAFDINLAGDNDKGFLLRQGGGEVALYSLKDFKEISPVATASAPGNRIINIPSVPAPAAQQSADTNSQPEITSVREPATIQPADTAKNPFSEMLDKILGKTTKPRIAVSSSQFPPSESATPQPDTIDENLPGAPEPGGHAEKMNYDSAFDRTKGNLVSPSVQSSDSGLQFINFLSDSSKSSSAGNMSASGIAVNKKAMGEGNVSRQTSVNTSSEKDTSSQLIIGNSDCQQLASEDFFQKVRHKMALRSDDESIYKAARKYFNGGVCFSTSQIQSLTYLFMSDEYKFKFLQLAYPHAYDGENFPTLIKTLTSDEYQQRFRAMVK